MENKLPTQFQIYSVLKQFSSADHPMNAAEIKEKLISMYHLPKGPDRKTVYSHIHELQVLSDNGILDCEIFAKKDDHNRTAGYYTDPVITKAEVKLLCDAIAYSRFIKKNHSIDLIKKIGGAFGKDFISKYKYILELKNKENKDYNDSFFNSIENIADAIEKGNKVTLQYLQYDLNKKLVPKDKENDGFRTVSPYNLVWTLNHYYLFCHVEEHGQDRFLRMDKIKNVTVLEDERIKPLPASFNVRDYIRNQAFMFGGDLVSISLRCEMRMLGQIIDFFGEDVEIAPIDDHYFRAHIKSSIESMKYWVLQYITAIDQIQPESLRKMIVHYLEDALRRNQ
ncbi:helix-turn-helix transcriptional regulator [Paenibacillus thalictri]|uniref:WYL domain-containing protein n=1 Tax=Paenibacillus thalictri TaxID=2527873 RepID=A0A4Q9DWW3_9BACL|nr:WYL domain-containing protein [Paenibacillus thalictri]TBL80845.1 WYL domain-containing protein [Paenibacillus thalictri]